MSKFAFASIRTCLLGAVALLSAAGVHATEIAPNNEGATKAVAPEGLAFLPLQADPEAVLAPAGWPAPRNLRLPAGCGTGGQNNGNFFNGILLTNTTGIGISAAASPTFMRADNFKVAGAGPQTISSVKWSAWTTQGTSPGIVTTTPAQLAGVQFIIAFYDEAGLAAGGTPNTATPVFTQTVTPTITTNATDTVPSGNASGVTTFPVLDFEATLAPGFAVTGGNCYWVEIRPVPGATQLAGRNYNWRASNQGDGYNLRRTTTTQVWDERTIQNGDWAFCFDIPLASVADNVTYCVREVASPMAFFADATSTSQTWDGTGTAFASHSAGAGFKIADNFTLNADTTINGISWQGVYITDPGAAVESFSIRILADSGLGVPSETPSTPGVGFTNLPFSQTFTQSSGLLRSALSASTNSFVANTFRTWSIDLTSAPIVLKPGCYWLEIRSANTTQAWFWAVKANDRAATTADSFFHQPTNAAAAYAIGTQIIGGDTVWSLRNTAPNLVRSTACVKVTAASNRTCVTATQLTVNGASDFQNNVFVLPPTEVLPPPALFDAPNANGNWYSIIGNGQDITVSTCVSGSDPRAAATTFDTILYVYCSQNAGSALADSCAGPLVPIAGNDDAVPACTAAFAGASTATFPSINGVRYLVYVFGVEGGGGTTEKGFFYINATSTTASTTAQACTDLTRCRIDIPSGAVTTGKACGAAATTDCTLATAVGFNQWATGTVDAAGGTRSQDIWVLPPAVSAVSGGQWFTVEFRSEAPAGFLWFRSDCVAGALSNGVGTVFTQCSNGDVFNIFVPAGGFHVVIRPPGFEGPLCDPANRGNRYVFRIRPADVGVCCVAGSQCSTTIAGGALRLSTDPNDCTGLNGAYLGNGTTCDPNDLNGLLPCELTGAPAGTVTGSCCDPYANCTLVAQAACPSGSTFTAAGVCDPDPCTTLAVQRCCQPTGVCIVIPASQCTAGGGTPATGTTCFPNSCPQPPAGVCCGNTGVCAITIQVDCPTSVPGISWSVGGSCSPNPCDQPRACCTGTACTVVTPVVCTNGGGTPQGAGVTVCFPDPCSAPATAVCCRGTTSILTTQAACTAPAGVGVAFLAGNSTVNGASNISPCCYRDFNKDNVGNIDDIFIYLNAWFAPASNPFTKLNGDGVQAANIDDLFIFLNVWFAGGCG